MLKMKVHIPELKRCCFCCPLRRGLMVFACLNLGVTFLMVFAHFMCLFYYKQPYTYANYKGFFVQHDAGICLMLLGCDTIAGFILLYALFKKNIKLLQVYFFYDVVALVAAIGLFVSTTTEELLSPYMLPIVFAGMVIQCYLMLLVWNEIKKLKTKQLEEIGLEIVQERDVSTAEKELQNGQKSEPTMMTVELTKVQKNQKESDGKVNDNKLQIQQ